MPSSLPPGFRDAIVHSVHEQQLTLNEQFPRCHDDLLPKPFSSTARKHDQIFPRPLLCMIPAACCCLLSGKRLCQRSHLPCHNWPFRAFLAVYPRHHHRPMRQSTLPGHPSSTSIVRRDVPFKSPSTFFSLGHAFMRWSIDHLFPDLTKSEDSVHFVFSTITISLSKRVRDVIEIRRHHRHRIHTVTPG
jgi:hypothetical protein